MPTVSVITPTYNRPELLSEAIQSVLAQTFTDFEMLIVDDGSEPSARRVVARFADPRLRYLRQPHTGRSVARNLGLQAARGDFICFLDDDDLYYPQKMTQEVAFFIENPNIDFVASGYNLVCGPDEIRSFVKPWLSLPELGFENCLYSCPLITCTVLMRRLALINMDYWFDQSLHLGEDTDFFLRMFLSGVRFAWVKEILSQQRLINKQPMRVLLEIHNNYFQIIDKIFQRIDLPQNIAKKKNEVIWRLTLNFAWQSYAYGLNLMGQSYLLRAVIQEPSLASKLDSRLVKGLLVSAKIYNDKNKAIAYIDHILSHLPVPLQHLTHQRDELHRNLNSQFA